MALADLYVEVMNDPKSWANCTEGCSTLNEHRDHVAKDRTMEDSFTDNIDARNVLDVCDNADGENILVTITAPSMNDMDNLTIALSADQARALAYALNVYAAGV